MGNPFPIGIVTISCCDQHLLNDIFEKHPTLHVSDQVVTISPPSTILGTLDQRGENYRRCLAKRWLIPNKKLLVALLTAEEFKTTV